MNGEIIYFGVPYSMLCAGVVRQDKEQWEELHIDRVTIPHMLHLMRIQGLPISALFLGKFECDEYSIRLGTWMLAKCDFPKLWEVPYYLRGVLLVHGESQEQTMSACISIHGRGA